MKQIPDGIFKPKLNSGETRSAVTSKVAQQIVNDEKALRDKKTERLRLSRLAFEEANPLVEPEKKAKPRRAADLPK